MINDYKTGQKNRKEIQNREGLGGMGWEGMEHDYSMKVTMYMLILLAVVLIVNKALKKIFSKNIVTFLIYFIGVYLLLIIGGKVLGKVIGGRRDRNAVKNLKDKWDVISKT